MSSQPALNIVPGQKLLLSGETFTVDKIRDGVLYLDDGKTLKNIPLDEVPAAFADGILCRAARRAEISPIIEEMLREIEVSQLTPAEQQAALRMLEYVNLLREQPRGQRSGAALKMALAEKARELGDPKPPIERTVYLNRRRFEGTGNDIRVLVPRIRHRGSRQTNLHPIVESIIDERISKSYLAASQISVAELHRLIEDDLKLENARRMKGDALPMPHPDTVRRRIAANYDPYEVVKSREGPKAADQHFRIVGRGPNYDRPLQMALIDATQLDLLIIDPFDGRPIRPWLTLVIDAYSRCVLGFCLSFAPPSRETTNQALRHAFGFKSYLKEKYPAVRSSYPCFGLPLEIAGDNGSEFKNGDTRLALASVGIDPNFNPAGKPHYKGAIERLFRTLNQRLTHMLPGTTRSNVQELGDYDPIKAARITYAELLEALHICICDIYHNTPHRELGDTPLNVWLRGTEKNPIEPPPSDEELCVLLGNTAVVTVQRNGITLDRIVYSAKWLTHLRASPGKEKNILVRYNPSDLSRIWVYDFVEKRYFPVAAAEECREYTVGLSSWEHEQVKKSLALDSRDDKYTGKALAEARRDLHRRFIELHPKDRKEARVRRRILGEKAAMEQAAKPARHVSSQILDRMAADELGASDKAVASRETTDVEAVVRTISEMDTRPGFGSRKRPKRESPSEPTSTAEPVAAPRPKKVKWLDMIGAAIVAE